MKRQLKNNMQLQTIKSKKKRFTRRNGKNHNGHNGRSAATISQVVERPIMPSDLQPGAWTEQAVKVLRERYLQKNDLGEVIETPDEMCWRVAWDIALGETSFGSSYEKVLAMARSFYELLASHDFLPNSPTLMNAGKGNGLQYNGCFVIPVDDSIEGIFDGIKWTAVIHKSGGGTGFSFSRLRPSGSRVGSTKGVASGPVSFMKIYDAATEQIKQGGSRRGANMGVLRVDHPDILEFIHCKEPGGINNFNISVTATDAFMKAYFEGTNYDLIDPKTNEIVGRLDAKRVMDEIADGAWRTGDPGMIFIDRINDSSANPVPVLGPIETTNPCGEQPLYPFDACNLGSIFLTYFIKEGKNGKKDVDWDRLEKVTKLSVRFLDNVIERNPIPLDKIAETVKSIRRIGLGIGGWADMLTELGISYDSEEAISLAEKIMKFINTRGHEASEDLAKERGPFPLWSQSIYKNKKPVRNSTITTIAPTGTIGHLAGTSQGIEPFFGIAFKHYVKTDALERTLYYLNPLFERVAEGKDWYTPEVKEKIASEGTISHIDEIPEDVKKLFRTAHDVSYDWHVRTQAAFQKYTDNSVSKTINMPSSATREEIKKAYVMAYETNCRGITVYRDGCKDIQVLNLGINGKKKEETAPAQVVLERPVKVEGATYKIGTPFGNAFITINQDENDNPFEIFIMIGKAGSEISAMAEALGRVISTTFRFGNHLPSRERAREIMEQLRGIGGGRSVGYGSNKIKSLPDAVAKAIDLHFGFSSSSPSKEAGAVMAAYTSVSDPTPAPADFKAKHADICPSCGASALVYEEGCAKCHACGHSEC